MALIKQSLVMMRAILGRANRHTLLFIGEANVLLWRAKKSGQTVGDDTPKTSPKYT